MVGLFATVPLPDPPPRPATTALQQGAATLSGPTGPGAKREARASYRRWEADQTSRARSRGRHLNRCPGAEDRVSLGQQSVAMDLRRSSKDRVVERMADMASLAKGQEPARLNRYVDVDRMDPVAKGRNEPIDPLVQR